MAAVNIAVSAAEIQENPGHGLNSIVVEATTDAPVSGGQTVDVAVSGDGITPGDFALSNVSIVIPDGESSGTVTFTSVNDPDLEIRETATLSLTNLSAGLQPGATMSLDVDIRDTSLPDLELSEMQVFREAMAPVVNWVGDEPCTWGGISCTSTNIVAITVVGENDELLPMPPTPNLPELVSLQLRKIELNGSVHSVKHFPKLRVLRFDDNQLSGPLSDITSGLSDNPDLVFFNAAENALTGPIPTDLWDNSLQVELANNSLSGTFPTEEPSGYRSNFNGNMIEGVLPDWMFPSSTLRFEYNKLDVANTPVIPGRNEGWRYSQTVPPTDVEVSSPSAGTAVLTWTPILYQEHGGHYEVLSSTTPGGPYTSRGTTAASGAKTATGLTVNGLPGGTNYFVVRTFTPKHALNPNDLTSINSEEVATSTGPLTVSLSASDAVADESGDPGTFRLTRDNPNDAWTVNLTRNGTSTAADTEFELTVGANPPIDVSGGNFSVTFPAGDQTLDITLTALVDANDEAEADETITLNLAAGDYVIDGSANTAAVTIAQNGFLVTTDTDGGTGSLRQAILNANAIPGPDTVAFDPSLNGTPILLSLTGPADDNALLGDLDITTEITIQGNGAANTIIDGGSDRASGGSNPGIGDRVLHVLGSGNLALDGVTVTGGNVNDPLFPGSSGGGIYIKSGGTATVTNATISGNSAIGEGGGILNSGTATVDNSTISGNVSVSGGGIANYGMATVANSTISGNVSDSVGGIVNFGTATVTNSTISGNSARDGFTASGVQNSNFSTITITNSTIFGNVGGGTWGVFNRSVAVLNNTIVAGNTGNNQLFGTFSGTNNLVSDGSDNNALTDTIVAEPLLGPLQDNGGPTFTHALLPGSPAIDAGSNANATEDGTVGDTPLATDQRGVRRIQFGSVDIGAVEQTPGDIGSTIVTTGDASWYLGPGAVGNDLRVYRQATDEDPVWVDGGLATRIGLAQDGTVVVQNDSGTVFARTGSADGIGTSWPPLVSVTAGDGATWFVGPDSLAIYRWAEGEMPVHSGGSGEILFVANDGSILTRNSAGNLYQRIGSDNGLGTSWQLLSESLIVTTQADENDGASVPQLGTGVSLREAIIFANNNPGPDTITFGDGSASGGTNFLDATPDTISLNLGELTITEDLTIMGNGSSLTILDGQDATRLFNIPGSAGDVTLQGLTFTRGQAPANDVGGAIANSANLQIDDSVFTANEAFLGAAINTDGTLTVNRSAFLANQAGFNGGAIRVFGSATITESTFAENSAGNAGGAIINHGSLQLANDTFSDNQADTGGAIENFGADTTATIINTTIHRNTATLGGGIYNNGGTATLNNTIVSGSPSGGDLITSTAPGSIAGTNNLVGDGNIPSGLSNTLTGDPLLGPLQNNGGPTATHALLPDSPAINAGTATAAPLTDQRGVTRDAVPDMGAFEVRSTAVVGAANTVTVAGNQITIDIFVENFGAETAGDLTLVNDLDGTFGAGNYVLASAPVLVSDPGTLTLSAAYDGSGTTDLLSAGSTLQSGGTAQIRIVVTLTTITDQGRGFGVYSNQAVVTSVDPSSVLSIDRSDSGSDPDPNGNGVPSEAGEDDATEFTVADITPPTVDIEINGGDAQRSMVSEITVRFSEVVSVDASSFSVQNTTTNTSFVPTVSSQIVNGKTVTTLTFSGPGIIGGSLPDGNYTLTVIDTQVTDTSGNILDGDGDGQAGVSATDDFFRLFGDADGDRDVDRRDFLFLLRSFYSSVGSWRFNPAMDFDGDGEVDIHDFQSFQSNYRRILHP